MAAIQPTKFVGESLNIWRLSFTKLQLAFGEILFNFEAALESCRLFSERIVQIYNNGRTSGRFERIFKQALPSWENKDGFAKVELHGFYATYPHRLHYAEELEALGADKEAFVSSDKHYLFFLYGTLERVKKVAFFAFTTRQAYNVVKNFADFQFPTRIAKAILLSNDIKDAQDRWTVGPVLASKEWYKEGETYENNPDTLEKVYISFKAVVNPTATALQAIIGLKTNVKVTRGSICFHKRVIPINQFPTLVAHLALIADGSETGLTNNAPPPPNNFCWLDYLVPIDEMHKVQACKEEAQRLICQALQDTTQPRSFTFAQNIFLITSKAPQ